MKYFDEMRGLLCLDRSSGRMQNVADLKHDSVECLFCTEKKLHV